MHGHVDECTAESIKEAQKQITKTDILRPILKIPEEQPMSNYIEQVVTINMVSETLKDELVEDEPPCI